MTTLIHLVEKRPVRWLVAAAWMLFFLILLLQSDHHPIIYTGIPPGPETLKRDILFSSLHMLGFAISTALLWWVLAGYMPSLRALHLAVAVAVVMGFVTEGLQGLTPDRDPAVIDLIADCMGAALIYYGDRLTEKLVSHHFAAR